jgi:glycosyltransferase involved in cell wall biosynthesis
MVKPKVAHVTTIDMSLRYLLLNQMLNIREEGYQVTGISSAGPYVPAIVAAGIRHMSVPMTRKFTPMIDLASLWRLYWVIRKGQFDIVHTHTPKPGLLGQIAARMAKVPIVINTLHGYYFQSYTNGFLQRFHILLEKIAAQCSDSILSQNSEDIETAIEEKICTRKKIKFLGNGIDLQRFDRNRLNLRIVEKVREELGLPLDVQIIGFVGRLVKEKGILELLEAARVVLQKVQDVRFLVIGPTDAEKCDGIAPEIVNLFGLSDFFLFTGLRQDMPELYSLMDIFVLPSHREGFPRSAMEASAMGVPCLVTDIRGCREAVDNGRNGLLVPLGNVNALADGIVKLLIGRETAKKMGDEGRRIAKERFDERVVFEKVKAEYARLLQEKRIIVPANLPGSHSPAV